MDNRTFNNEVKVHTVHPQGEWDCGRLCRIACMLETLGNISGPIKASRWMGVGVQRFSRRVRWHFLLNMKAAAAVLTVPVEFYIMLRNIFRFNIPQKYFLGVIQLNTDLVRLRLK
jgi:hypothetical protein